MSVADVLATLFGVCNLIDFFVWCIGPFAFTQTCQ